MKNLVRILAVIMALSSSQIALAEEKNPVGKFILGFDQVDDVNNLDSVGSPFDRALKLEYNRLANVLHNDGYTALARTFATKGVEAAKGNLVPLEKITEWNKKFLDTNAFAIEHARLNKLLDAGARNLAPVNAAIAQGAFDCWLALSASFPEKHTPTPAAEPAKTDKDAKATPAAPSTPAPSTPAGGTQAPTPTPNAETKTTVSNASKCKQRYTNAVSQIETQLKIPSDAQIGRAPVSSQQTPSAAQIGSTENKDIYIIYFDTNSTFLDAEDMDIIEQASKQFIRTKASRMMITGYTDTKGSVSFNRKLSTNRSSSVRAMMINYNVPATAITIDAFGEKSLAVDTKDGKSEEKNRRVEITMQ